MHLVCSSRPFYPQEITLYLSNRKPDDPRAGVDGLPLLDLTGTEKDKWRTVVNTVMSRN